LSLSVSTSTQVPPHSVPVSPVQVAPHWPWEHTMPDPHATSHAPQFFGSVAVVAQYAAAPVPHAT
jgi:hypothetical protein